MILAWTVDELLHGQADDWRTDTRTHTHTHAGNDNTRRPKLASGNKTVWIWVQVQLHLSGADEFTHWGRVTHICVGKLTIIASDYGLSPVRHQAIIWTNAGILLIQTLGTNISEILSEIHKFAFKEMHLKMSSGKWWLFCLGLNMLTLNVRGPIYLGFTRSISWLLMPWLHTSPGHQQPWYWPCRICRSWSYLRKDFKYTCRINED